MKSYLSLKPGATFFLGSSRTLVYHKDDVEIIYRHKMDGKKYLYIHLYMYLMSKDKVTLYADWGDYFTHLSSITDHTHFDNIMRRPCPTFVEILTNQDHTKVGLMSMNGGVTMGLGLDVDITEIEDKLTPAALPFHPLVADGCNALMKVSNKLYNEISGHCPLKLWKDRLTAVWGDETR